MYELRVCAMTYFLKKKKQNKSPTTATKRNENNHTIEMIFETALFCIVGARIKCKIQ